MKQVVLLVALALAIASPAQAGGAQVTYAIVIGNNAPPATGTAERLAPLRYADDDAARYAQLFSRLGDARLLVVLDADSQRRYPELAAAAVPPTRANLARVVDELRARMAADLQRGDRPVLYFAFSGHGARDERGEAFLALHDGALTQQALFDDVLARLPATFAHVIIDACHSGGVVGVRGDGGFFGREVDTTSAPATAAEVDSMLKATTLAKHPHVGVILATTLGQEAFEWSAIESGVFTHEVLSGLHGAADINGDQVIEYTELQAFVAAANREIEDRRAVPQVIARPPATNHRAPLLALSRLANVRWLRGDASKLGHFFVELANGQRYLDAHLAPGTTVALALPDGVPAFVRTSTHEASVPARGPIALADVRLAPRTVASRGSVEAQYQTALFAAHYGRAYYQGFVDSIGAVGVRFPAPVEPVHVDGTRSRRGQVAIGSAVVAGVSAAVSITTGVLAYRAREDYQGTTLQRPAREAQDRYERYLPIAVTSGALALASGAVAYWLWPRGDVAVAPAVDPARGGYGVSVQVSW